MLILAVVAAFGASRLMPPARTGSIERNPSSFYNEPYGTKAAFLALRKMGYQAIRLRRPIDNDTLAQIDALAILRPTETLNTYEQEALLAWVEAGHQLLIAPPPHSAHLPEKDTAQLSDWFRFARFEETRREKAHEDVRTQIAANSHPLLDGTQTLVARRGQRFLADSPVAGPLAASQAQAIWTDELGVVAAQVDCGEGSIIALADVHALTNEGLRQADNAVWMANLVRHLTGGRTDARLAIDEYHAGFPYRDPSWLAVARLLLTEGWGWCVGQILLVTTLFLYARGSRFGRPADLRIAPRRRHGEFTTAGGRLLHDAKATDLAYKTLYHYYRTRICKAVNLPAGADDAAMRSALAAHGRSQWAEWLATAAPSAISRPPTRRDVLHLSERIQLELETLEHGA